MISICIPTYNYCVVPLINELVAQAEHLQIDFEIVIADDASPDSAILSKNLLGITHNKVKFIRFETNMGRSKIRNYLAKNALFDWLLFLDADTFPTSNLFLKNYLKSIKTAEVVVGGILYRTEKPIKEKLLRWYYGHNRETITLQKRVKNSYQSFMTGNFMIHKTIFSHITFDESIVEYGHEDTLFGIELQHHNIRVKHISNPVFHDGLEENAIFIDKTKRGIDNLLQLLEMPKFKAALEPNIKLLRIFRIIQQTEMTNIIAFWFKHNELRLVERLNQDPPSMRSFDLFKIGYLCLKKRDLVRKQQLAN